MNPTAKALLTRLTALERRVRAAIAARRTTDPNPDDPFRGLYLSDACVDALLDDNHGPFEPGPTAGGDAGSDSHAGHVVKPERQGRLATLATAARLSPLDVDMLLIALAPDVDSRYEQFYGYLNDDVTHRRATPGLTLRLCGLHEADPAGRARLHGDAPLRRTGIIVLDDTERPFLSRTLRVPDRVTAHLLGDDRPDPLTTAVRSTDDLQGLPSSAESTRLARALANGTSLVHLRQLAGGSAPACAAAALAAASANALQIEPARVSSAIDQPETLRCLVREALVTGAGVICGPVGSGPETNALIAAFADTPVPLLLWSTTGWNPAWGGSPPLQLDVHPLNTEDRASVWRSALNGHMAADADPIAATAHFTLDALSIRRAAASAALAARSEDSPVEVRHLQQGARAQNAASLEHLTRRIEPTVSWKDLVLPTATEAGIRELAARARHRGRVLTDWAMRPGGGRGHGVTGLFAGDSGTGKTMSTEVVAADLGLDMYTVNLATVVDKYIGETEKNLEKIFSEAAGVNGVLLFDEADAIFGKRSDVRDAHDRYANVESAYLLQRLESFDGLAILSTNLRANLDEAFTRRLDVVVDFPVPDAALRKTLWDRCLGVRLPRAADVDLEFLAEAFDLAGGNIRSSAVTAAYLAAAGDRPVTMADIIGAVAREYRKLGRMLIESEFGKYMPLTAV